MPAMKRLFPAILSFHSSVERFCGGQGVMDLAHGARDGLCVSQYLCINSLMEPLRLLHRCIKTMVMKESPRLLSEFFSRGRLAC